MEHIVDLHLPHQLFQSVYKEFHSTETAFLRVHSDIVHPLDGKKCVLLILLDLSDAFNTIDHDILLDRLQSLIGLSGKPYNWFCRHIRGRQQSVVINGIPSTFWELLCGVPQGSVLSPLLFYNLHQSTQ